MAAVGGYVGVNLGPMFLGGGGSVPLNLGVEWDDNPVEPVIRGLSAAASMQWGRAPLRRLHVAIGWGAALVVRTDRLVPWGGANRIDQQASVAWGISPHLLAGWALRWGKSAGVAAGRTLSWQSLPRVAHSLSVDWYSFLPARRASSDISWAQGTATQVGTKIVWHGEPDRVAGSWASRWRSLRQARRMPRLPWGRAKPLPWIVRPPVKPDPDPDPEPQFPPGHSVPLNLGCTLIDVPGLAPLNLGTSACYVVRPQRRTYVVINTVSLVRLPDRVPIEVTRISLGASRGTWGWTFDIELADPQQLALLKPTTAGPRQFEVNLNGYVWTGIIESFQKQREFNGGGVRLSGRSRTALLAAPYAPARVKATTEERSMAQLVAEELADTGFASTYDTVDWNVPAGAWFYDASTPLDAISALAEASGGVVQSDPAAPSMRVRAAYPVSPWDWRTTQPDHVLQEDIVLTESLQMRSAPLYDAVVVTGELAGKGVTCKVRKSGEEGRLYAQQVSSPLITVPAAGAERGRNILCDRGEQAAVDLTVPLFAQPLKAGEVGLVLPLDLVEVVGADGTWHGQCESLRIEVSADDRAVVIEQTATLERHYTDAD